MGSVNWQKVIVGGLVAGIVLAVLDYLAWTYLLTSVAASTPGAISAAAGATMDSKRAMVGGAVSDILVGLAIVWCYAAIRPRYGAGAKTGMRAAVFVWIVGGLAYVSFYFFRLMALEFFCEMAIVTLVEYLIVAYIGCRMYSEGGTA